MIIFGVDMSSSSCIDNKLKYIFILRKGSTQGLEHALATESCTQLILPKKMQNFV